MTGSVTSDSVPLFNRSAESMNALQGLWQIDDQIRKEQISVLQRTIDSWYYGFGSPAVPGFLETMESDTDGTTCDTTMHHLIREQIIPLLRVFYTVPWPEIRKIASCMLEDVQSFFFPHALYGTLFLF